MAKNSLEKPNKTLIIAEKPSVARDIRRCIDDTFADKENYFEGGKYIISFALGHLLTIQEPSEMDERYKSWTLKTLPIIPEEYTLKPIPKVRKQLASLKKLVLRKDVETIINACDAGREGELIFSYILNYATEKKAHTAKNIQRLWLQSMTDSAIKHAFSQLRTQEEMKPLADAAISRAEADWLIGINSSRGLTSFKSKNGGFFVTPCGRVQTPTLAMLVERENKIKAFLSQPYWTLQATFLNKVLGKEVRYTGNYIQKNFSKEKQQPGRTQERIFDEKKADEILQKCLHKTGKVEEKLKESKESCPLLYDLTSLQKEANNRFGYSAKYTLSLLQLLYERHKLLTYPRTSSRHLPEDYLADVKKTMHSIADSQSGHGKLASAAAKAISQKYIGFNKRVFDTKKVTDHHALIPTGKKSLPSLSPEELKIYTMVAQRFVAIFFPPSRIKKTTRFTHVEDELFKTEGRIIAEKGWREVYGRLEEDRILEALSSHKEGEILVDTAAIEKNHAHTKPPPRYNEASLLSAMEGAGKIIEDEALREAMKERGLGTPATRAAIIEKLISDRYVVKEARELLPTSKALDLLSIITCMQITELCSAGLTGEWEFKLALIEKNQLARKTFMHEIAQNTMGIVEKIKNFDENITKQEAVFSPIEDLRFFEYLTYYESEDKSFFLKKTIGGRKFSHQEAEQLIKERKIGPFSDFRSKRGMPFTATILLEAPKNKIKFIFSGSDEETDSLNIDEAEVIGTWHSDGSTIYKTLSGFVSKSFLDDKTKGFRIPSILLGKELESTDIKRLISGEKTELIKGFRSTKSKRLFDAFLELKTDGKLSFFFPERAPRKPKAKK